MVLGLSNPVGLFHNKLTGPRAAAGLAYPKLLIKNDTLVPSISEVESQTLTEGDGTRRATQRNSFPKALVLSSSPISHFEPTQAQKMLDVDSAVLLSEQQH